MTREEALQILDENKMKIIYGLPRDISAAVLYAEEVLQEPERKRGKWIIEPPYRSVTSEYKKGIECPFCHSFFVSDGNKPYELHPFCCECGADMRGK